MIDFHTYQQIHQLHFQEQLSIAKIAAQLHLHPETVSNWIKRPRYEARKPAPRASKLDPFGHEIQRLLQQHPFTARQIFHRLRESGYTGQYSMVRKKVRALRPPANKAFLSLQFLPGQCSQVDWGHAGWIQIGSTRRRVSFLVLVLCYSRKMYVEFTLGQTMEQFLSAQQNAFLFTGGLTAEIMVDNCETAVLDHPIGGPATLHPRYIDFAQHYGFAIKACTPRQPQQKGRVESAVGYIKTSFLNGLELHSLDALNAQAQHWLNTVANVRVHAHTRRPPDGMFLDGIPKIRPLTLQHRAGGDRRTAHGHPLFRDERDHRHGCGRAHRKDHARDGATCGREGRTQTHADHASTDRLMLNRTFIAIATLSLTSASVAQDSLNVRSLFQWDDPLIPIGDAQLQNQYNEVWGYAANGREYAFIGSTVGLNVFDVTDPENSSLVDQVAGRFAGSGVIHRDYKVHAHHLYAVCAQGPSSLQIFDLQYLPDSVRLVL